MAMNEHDEIRELLSLAAAGALDAKDESRVAAHANSCGDCARELQTWQEIQAGMRRIPTPQVPPALFARTIALARAGIAEESERRFERRLLAVGVILSWVLTALSWPLAQLLAKGWMAVLGVGFTQRWENFAVLTALCWLAGGAAAVLLGWHRQRERRLA
jgi:anti-sigma factor RsiW